MGDIFRRCGIIVVDEFMMEQDRISSPV